MKKIISSTLLIILLITLCSCKGKTSVNANMYVELNNKKIQLYMTREDVENIVGKPDSISKIGEFEYGSYSLFYSDGLLTGIMFNDETISTMGGLHKGMAYSDSWDLDMITDFNGCIIYKITDKGYEHATLENGRLENGEFPEIGEYARFDISLHNKDKTILIMSIFDNNVAHTLNVDKE